MWGRAKKWYPVVPWSWKPNEFHLLSRKALRHLFQFAVEQSTRRGPKYCSNFNLQNCCQRRGPTSVCHLTSNVLLSHTRTYVAYVNGTAPTISTKRSRNQEVSLCFWTEISGPRPWVQRHRQCPGHSIEARSCRATAKNDSSRATFKPIQGKQFMVVAILWTLARKKIV